MKQLYQAVGIALMVMGAWYILEDVFKWGSLFSGMGVLVGFTLMMVSTLNLLNWAYGHSAQGVKYSAFGANAGFLVVALGVGGLPDAWREWLTLILLGSVFLLAFSKESLRAHNRAA